MDAASRTNTKWKQYHMYKDSDVEWLGEVPEHWEVKRLRFICKINPTKSELYNLASSTTVSFLPMEAISENGLLNLEETRNIEQVWQGYTHFKDNDVIIAKITPCFENGKGALCKGLLGGIGFGTTELQVLQPSLAASPEFIFYITKSHPFRSLGIASMKGAAGQKRVTDDFIKDFTVGLPQPVEQCAIAAFLDHETSKIDALIAKKERLIELLQEKRAALISHAVTKGLDPNVSMKDSGVEWIGQIPEQWKVVSIRNLIRKRWLEIQDGNHGELHPTSDDYTSNGIPFLMANDIRNQAINFISCKFISKEQADGLRIGFSNPCDVLLTHKGTLGETAIVPIDLPYPYIMLTPQITYYRSRTDNLLPEHIHYQMLSKFFKEQLMYLSLIQTTRGYVGIMAQKAIRIIIPPKNEQKQIAQFLSNNSSEMGKLIAKAKESIQKLQEYRTALISAAVTGKIDVRNEMRGVV